MRQGNGGDMINQLVRCVSTVLVIALVTVLVTVLIISAVNPSALAEGVTLFTEVMR